MSPELKLSGRAAIVGHRMRDMARASAQPTTYLGVATLVFIYSALAYLTVSDRQTAHENAVRHSRNIVGIFEQAYSSNLKSVDDGLLFLRRAYERSPATFDLSAMVRDSPLSDGLIINFVMTNASGRIIDTAFAKEFIGSDRSQEEAFRFQANSTGDALYIGRPVVLKSGGRRGLVLNRRLTTPDGTFAGVIAAFIDPGQLGKPAGGFDLGVDGTFALTGFDGVVRTRVVNGEVEWKNVGRQIAPNAGVLAYATQAKSGSFWNQPGLLDDNVSRLISFQVLESFPLVAVVTVSEEVVYRHANGNARIYWALVSSFTLAILIAVGIGAWREHRLIRTTLAMKQAQEELRRSQERYALVEETVNDGIFDRNLVTGKAYISPRWKAILGYTDEELPNVASCYFDLIHPDDRAAVDAALEAHMRDNRPYGLDFRLRCRNGAYRWVHSRGKMICDAENRPVRMIGISTDISDRKRSEAMIEESRNNLARAERLALLGHYKIESGSIVWSEGTYRILGELPESFMPTLSAAMRRVHPGDRSALANYLRDVLAGGDHPPITVRAIKDGGQIIYVENWSSALRLDDGAISGIFGTLQDVTERRQTENMLAQANQELETRVAERTAELAQEMRRREEAQLKLAQTQKMEAVGQLTAGIAHDFNNLLAVIGGGIEIIDGAAARGLTAEPELIDAVLRATRRGRDLVQRLLAFARQSPLRAEPTSVNRLVLDTLRLLQRTIGEGVDIVTRLNAVSAMVSVDRNQLANALLNLALNARDAMPEGGELRIATLCRPVRAPDLVDPAQSAEEVCIIVSDTGIGMSEEVRNRAFDPFFTTKADGLGSGLGLSMVLGFVEQSGGRIEIDSEFGRGTTITISLPRIAWTSHADEAEMAAGSSVHAREKTVLLVEDDPDVRTVTAAQLKQLGYRVHAVSNGMEAIDLIASPANIDVTLTDIVLPGGIDGVTLLKEAMRARPRMGVLCMSGYNPTQKHRKWLEVQNIEFLEKPFSSRRLAQALDSTLAQ